MRTMWTNLRMIAALSVVPIEDTLRAFEALANHCGQEEQVILDYFESTYIGELIWCRNKSHVNQTVTNTTVAGGEVHVRRGKTDGRESVKIQHGR